MDHPPPGAVGPVDAVLPGLRGDAPATWLDAAPPRGAAVGEQVGRAPAPVGAWAPDPMNRVILNIFQGCPCSDVAFLVKFLVAETVGDCAATGDLKLLLIGHFSGGLVQ